MSAEQDKAAGKAINHYFGLNILVARLATMRQWENTKPEDVRAMYEDGLACPDGENAPFAEEVDEYCWLAYGRSFAEQTDALLERLCAHADHLRAWAQQPGNEDMRMMIEPPL